MAQYRALGVTQGSIHETFGADDDTVIIPSGHGKRLVEVVNRSQADDVWVRMDGGDAAASGEGTEWVPAWSWIQIEVDPGVNLVLTGTDGEGWSVGVLR